MKKILICALMAVGLTAVAQQKIQWLNPEYDFGTFDEDLGKVSCSFKGVNVGDSAVSVLSARANCGCTVPSFSKEPVMPGDTLVVIATYDAIGRPGRFSKLVYVTTTASENDKLRLSGVVVGSANTLQSRYPVGIGRVRTSNNVMSFGQTRKGRTLAGGIQIYNSTDHPIRPRVIDAPRYIHSVYSPAEIVPGDQGVVSFTAYTVDIPDYGLVTADFGLIPDQEMPDSVLQLSASMIVVEDFSKMSPAEKEAAPKAVLSTEKLDFGRVKLGSKPVSKTFTVKNEGKTKMKMRRAYSPERGVSVSCNKDEVAVGKSATVTVTVDPAQLPTEYPLDGRITIITNTPDAPTQVVRIVAETIE